MVCRSRATAGAARGSAGRGMQALVRWCVRRRDRQRCTWITQLAGHGFSLDSIWMPTHLQGYLCIVESSLHVAVPIPFVIGYHIEHIFHLLQVLVSNWIWLLVQSCNSNWTRSNLGHEKGSNVFISHHVEIYCNIFRTAQAPVHLRTDRMTGPWSTQKQQEKWHTPVCLMTGLVCLIRR
jgi:hypothetical protein